MDANRSSTAGSSNRSIYQLTYIISYSSFTCLLALQNDSGSKLNSFLLKVLAIVELSVFDILEMCMAYRRSFISCDNKVSFSRSVGSIRICEANGPVSRFGRDGLPGS